MGLRGMKFHLLRSHPEVTVPKRKEELLRLCAFRTMAPAEMQAIMESRNGLIKYPFAQGKGKACKKKHQPKPDGKGAAMDKQGAGKNGAGKDGIDVDVTGMDVTGVDSAGVDGAGVNDAGAKSLDGGNVGITNLLRNAERNSHPLVHMTLL